MGSQGRVTAGIPTGGQFAATQRGESDVELDAGITSENTQVAAMVPREGDLAGYYAATDAKHFDHSTPGSTFTDPGLRRVEDVVALASRQRGGLDGDDRAEFVALGVPASTMRADTRCLLVHTAGDVGVMRSEGLPGDTPVRIERTKPGQPCIPVIDTEAAPTTEVATLIIGPNPKDPQHEVVYTTHPGLPIPAAEDARLDDLEGQTVPLSSVRQAFGGQTWLTCVAAKPRATPRAKGAST